MSQLLHPCHCDDYNGSQCYNCLNGAHRMCNSQKTPCKKRNAKRVGVMIVIRKIRNFPSITNTPRRRNCGGARAPKVRLRRSSGV